MNNNVLLKNDEKMEHRKQKSGSLNPQKRLKNMIFLILLVLLFKRKPIDIPSGKF